MPTLDQAAMPLDLSWTQGDPVHFNQVFVGKQGFWTGPATVEAPATPTLQSMVATFTNDGANDVILDLSLSAINSALLAEGEYEWALRIVGGPLAAAGRVVILGGAATSDRTGPNKTLIAPQDVFDWMGTPNPDEEALALMQTVVSAVIVRISRGHSAPAFDDEDWRLAHVMQCARIWKRKGSPEGVIANAEFGPIRVTRLDNDVAEMLAEFSKGPWPSV